MSKAKERHWKTSFTRKDGSPGSGVVKAKNENGAIATARRQFQLEATTPVKAVLWG